MRVVLNLFLIGAAAAAATPAGAFSFTQGDLVISIEGGMVNGSYVGDNQAAPITLQELSPNGTSSVSTVGSMTLPDTNVTVGGVTSYAVSGEYGSSSEGTLQLSGNGHYLTIMGYGVNPADFNANPAAYGAVLKDGALAQSTSALVPRVVALIGADGSVNSTTGLTNVFNTNNGRSAYTVNGTSFYVSGQGASGDTTGGVFQANLGANTATPITTANDTREVQVYNNTLYVSQDYNGSSGAQNTNISALKGPGNTLPTSSSGLTINQLVPQTGASITLTAATANGVNNSRIGTTVYLSPENYFFASSNVLYVADSGSPKNGNAGKAGLGDGGLQKWTLSGGVWTLDYTLYLGLGLVNNAGTSGVTGLYGLTGEVIGDEVELFATSYTIGDLDQSYLYGITDQLDALTAAPDESFTTLLAGAANTNIKGVAFAPSVTAVPEPSSLTLLALGAGALVPVVRVRARRK